MNENHIDFDELHDVVGDFVILDDECLEFLHDVQLYYLQIPNVQLL